MATVTFPFGLLIGIGSFDYWAYYFSGKPPGVDDHAGHGARKWQDYFRPNTDHKVIGVQYLATTMTFFVIGGFLAMLFRAELASASGRPVLQPADLQRAHLGARRADDLRRRRTWGFAGLGNAS